MSRFMDDARQQRVHDHVARELEIASDVLNAYAYEIDTDGHGLVWRILWADAAPPDVATRGVKGALWSEVHPYYEREL